jgi:hypothetical protein
VEIVTRGFIVVLDEHETALLGRQLADAVKLWHARGSGAPAFLEAFSGRVNTAVRAAKGRTSEQVKSGRGPGEAAPGRFPPCSDEPVRMTTKEAAVLAEVDPRTMRKWIEGGAVEADRGPRGAHRVDMSSLVVWLSQHRRQDEP